MEAPGLRNEDGTPSTPLPAAPRSAEAQRRNLHFVLVHGVGHGGWCWYRLRRLLEDHGHKVSCPDLASAGIEMSNPNELRHFEEYNRPLLDLLSGLPEGEKVVLVGHSAGGQSLTHAIREFGDAKIELAVYVAATMLRGGFVTEQDFKDGDPDLSQYGDVVQLIYGQGLENPPTSGCLRPQFQQQILYQLSPDEDVVLASMLLRPWPIRALSGARFEGGEERIDKVRRAYIKTLRDHVLKPEQQEAMIQKWAPIKVMEVESDHSPFFSATKKLFDLLLHIVEHVQENDCGM